MLLLTSNHRRFIVIVLITFYMNTVKAVSTSSTPNKTPKRQRSFDLNVEAVPEDFEENLSTSPIQSHLVVKDEKSVISKPYKMRKEVILKYAKEKDKCDHDKTCLHWKDLSIQEKKTAYDRRRYFTQTKRRIQERNRSKRLAHQALPEEMKRLKYDKYNAYRKLKKSQMTPEEIIQNKRKEKERSQRRRDAIKLLQATQNAINGGKKQ